MEVPQKCVKQMNDALTGTRDQRAKMHSSGDKDGLFLFNGGKRGSIVPLTGGDGKQVEAAAERRANRVKPSSRLSHMTGRVMCEGAKKLSPEEMALLEIDIFKPLDFYEILLNRTKESSNGRIISNLNELQFRRHLNTFNTLTMEVPQKCVKQMNDALTGTRDQKAKVHSFGDKDGLFLFNSGKRGSIVPSIGGDGKQVEVAAQRRANRTKPSSRLSYMTGRVMCEGAKKLSPEEMALLEIDIFKPLDFYEILLNRTKESSNGRIISNLNEL
ncbi:hypothetical protein ACROYT_G021246 [Oculina patagonica]